MTLKDICLNDKSFEIDGLQVEDPNLGGSEFKQNFQSLKDVSVRELFNSKTVSQKSELEESLNVENKK